MEKENQLVIFSHLLLYILYFYIFFSETGNQRLHYQSCIFLTKVFWHRDHQSKLIIIHVIVLVGSSFNFLM